MECRPALPLAGETGIMVDFAADALRERLTSPEARAPTPAPTRKGRPGPAPPPPPDVLGPVLRVLIQAVAFRGLRQYELIGLRCRWLVSG